MSQESFYITITFLGVIAIVFIFFIFQASKMFRLYRNIAKANENDNVLESLESSKISTIKTAYEQSINIETPQGKKTNIPASEYFSEFNACKTQSLNVRLLDTASGTLVGLGLLGTFLGLTLGVKGFNSSTTELIQASIKTLLGGMGTAFLTSLVGMSFSLIYTACDKFWRNRLAKHLYDLTESLDRKYYIDDVSLTALNQEKLLNHLYTNIKNITENQTNAIDLQMGKHTTRLADGINRNLEQQSSVLQDKLVYTNVDGQQVTLGNAIREILKENSEQSVALKSFSTDLAIQLNDGFDEVLSRQMQEKILPLMENVDKTTNAIVEHIDNMADSVSSPATDMIQNVVNELKGSMSTLMTEFKTGFSDSATNELESIATQLGTAAQAMADFPSNMENISATLQVTIEEVKKAVTEISDTSANANSTAMQQMQEQITFATGAINNALEEVKEVMTSMSKSSQSQSEEMASKFSMAADKLGEFLNGTFTQLSSSVADSVSGITEHISNTVSDITENSANANLAATQKMQEQISFATEAMNNALFEVKDAMQKMSESSQNQSNQMVNKLSEATDKMGQFLDGTISQLSDSVQKSVNGVTEHINQTVSDITTNSANANSAAMHQMQEQISYATDAIKMAIVGVKEAMDSMTSSSQNQNNEMTNNLVTVSEKITKFLDGTMSNISTSMQDSMRNITDDVNEKQTELITLQKETTNQTRILLDTFNLSLNRLEKMNEYIKGTMDMFQKAQGQITGSTAHLQTISGDMKLATELFNNSQKDYSNKMLDIQRNSQHSIESVTTLLSDAGNLSSEYVDQFGTIKQSLVSIFSQLQNGLNEYSRTVQSSTQKYLDLYSSNLTETTDALASTIQQQNEVVEMLVESLNHKK